MSDKATERPWRVTSPVNRHDAWDILAGEGANIRVVAKVPEGPDTSWREARANAALIVRAVNNMEPLCEALAECVSLIRVYDKEYPGAFGDLEPDDQPDVCYILADAKAALKAAGWEG